MNEVYSALLARCGLTVGKGSHTFALTTRGLSPEEIRIRQYGTLRLEGRAEKASELQSQFGESILSVPGFHVREGNRGPYLTIAGKPGLLVPVRDLEGRIVALKIRPDGDGGDGKYRYLSSKRHGGPGPGSPVHVPLDIVGPVELVRVTEGELKADIATAKSGVPTISIPGVGNWRPSIRVLCDLGAKTVRLAFDADSSSNKEVGAALLAYSRQLKAEGFAVELERWPADAGKGIDDVLAAGKAVAIEIITDNDATKAIEETAAAAGANLDAPPRPIIEGPNEAVEDPHRLARVHQERHGTADDGELTLRFWRDEWQQYRGGAYHPIPESDIRAALIQTIKSEFDAENVAALESWIPSDERPEPPKARKVTTGIVSNTRQALASITALSSKIEQPAWLDDNPPEGFTPDEMLATASGLLHLPSLVAGQPALLLPTPRFFSTNVVPYGFDPHGECPEWSKFLRSVWPDDAESIDTLQEWFGYMLLPDTRHHKLLMILGPKRSGKGTIVRALKGVVGSGSIASPTLASLAGPFGLWPLLGKTVAVVADARLSGRTDAIAVVERLLSISGEDPQDVHRKNLPTLTGIRLPVRFTVLSNELPNMRDASGALTSRVVMLRMTRSFYGIEDKKLGERIATELPGILQWSISGWQRLQERGAFQQPASARELMDDLDHLASPIAQFIAERCEIGPQHLCAVDDLFDEWKRWCEKHGRDHAGTVQVFGKELRAALPQLDGKQPERADGTRFRAYQGIRLK